MHQLQLKDHSIADVIGPEIKASNKSESGKPNQSKVSINIKYINNKNMGIPKIRFVTILSTFSEKGTLYRI